MRTIWAALRYFVFCFSSYCIVSYHFVVVIFTTAHFVTQYFLHWGLCCGLSFQLAFVEDSSNAYCVLLSCFMCVCVCIKIYILYTIWMYIIHCTLCWTKINSTPHTFISIKYSSSLFFDAFIKSQTLYVKYLNSDSPMRYFKTMDVAFTLHYGC